ncbi:DUF1080 domain-containing protein [bacterium]|nr:DUF1080 domain-containing protein [bacterium]
MNKRIMTIVILMTALHLIFSVQCSKEKGPSIAEPFLDRWALYLPGGAGWIEVRQEENYLDGDLLWYGGSVLPVSSVVLNNDTLIVTQNSDVVRERDEDNNPVRTQTLTTWIECYLQNEELVGKALIPNRNGIGIEVTPFTGKRIPPLPDSPNLSKIEYGDPISLFNGKDLTGWVLTDTTLTNGFRVENGVLINDPVQKEGEPRVRYGNIRTIDEFEDFNLNIDVNIAEHSNSGIYLRGIYEIQINDSYQQPLDSHNMGALYSRLTPSTNAEKPAGEWQHLDITLCDRHLTVILNGVTIIDNQPILGVTGGALTADQFSPGPIYLQGDHGKVSFRNIQLRPIIH